MNRFSPGLISCVKGCPDDQREYEMKFESYKKWWVMTPDRGSRGFLGPWSLPDPVVVVSSLIHRQSVINQSGSKSPLTTAGTLIKNYSGITSLFLNIAYWSLSYPPLCYIPSTHLRVLNSEELSYYSLNW